MPVQSSRVHTITRYGPHRMEYPFSFNESEKKKQVKQCKTNQNKQGDIQPTRRNNRAVRSFERCKRGGFLQRSIYCVVLLLCVSVCGVVFES